MATKTVLETDLTKEWLKRAEGIEQAIARIEGMVSTACVAEMLRYPGRPYRCPSTVVGRAPQGDNELPMSPPD